MKIKNQFIYQYTLMVVSILFLISCQKKEDNISDLDKLRKSNNYKSYSVSKIDSSEVIKQITQQKVQEVLDLSTLYIDGNKNTKIDSTIYSELLKYFEKQDSVIISPLFKELDSLKVKTAKVKDLEIIQNDKSNENLTKFNIEYFGENNKSLGTFERNAHYILKTNPQLFKKEFKFFFLDFYPHLEKEKISEGVTK